MGNGLDDGVALGPLVNAEGRDKVIELVDDAVKKGAKVLTGGKKPDGAGLLLSGDRADERAGRRQDAERGNLRAGGVDPDLQDRRTRRSGARTTPNTGSSPISTPRT